MPRRSRHPVNAEVISDYDTLRFYAKKFGQGAYNCLIFIGPPGRLKSSIIEEETQGHAYQISGNSTPFEVFCDSQIHKNENLVIDDADGLYGDPAGQRLLTALTNPKCPKRVPWNSDAPIQRGLAKVFETSSKVCIIDNAWHQQNERIAALEDRSRLFLFNPPPIALHEEMGRQEWYNDEDVYRFIGDNVGFFSDLSARLYVKASEAKQAGEDWRAYILRQCVDPVDLHLIMLEYDDEWKDRGSNEKAEEFLRRTGHTARATYFNHRKRLYETMRNHPLKGKWAVGG